MIEMIVFTNPGCAPCEQVKSSLSEISWLTSLDQPIKVVCTYENPGIAEMYKVSEQPCTIVLKNGVEKLRHIGAYINILDVAQKINNVL